ncbi:MAG: hypothetical protein IMW89_17875 [Ktedonobacteraceae bacterium]|nr:hypothetical protein [Ktedonobacteraceae bacterium]
MPKRAQYTVSWSPEQALYLFTDQAGESARPLAEYGEDLLAWLEEHHAFAFHGRSGQLNLLKERRGREGEGYWYAYRRRNGRMVKRYAGRSAQVSLEHLEQIAASLANGDETQPHPAFVPQLERSTASRADAESTARFVQFEPLLMPKLQWPRLPKSLLTRERLLQLLDEALEYRVTLISAPAGYGKTTLVGQWLAERSVRPDFPHVASVTLDEGDNDPIRFWRYVIAACQQFQPELGREALELLLAHRLPPFKPLSMMLTVLLNELSRLEQPCVLILDDVHVITSLQVAETLSFFLEHLPASFHLVMLIRGELSFSLTRLRAHNELLDIYPPLLSFSLEETRAFFAQELPFTLSPKILHQIYKRLEGWPTGLRLLARELQQSASEWEIEQRLATLASSYWSIRDYFLNEVLHTLPVEQQEFLLQTSFLPRISAPLCDAITGRTDSAQQLAALYFSDLFLIPLDGTGKWGRFHSLFAEAMQQEARRRLGDERLRQLAARASSWYEEHDFRAEAIETALSAAEFVRSARLISRFIESKQQGNAPTIPELYILNRWLERLPTEELERHPDLCLHYALILIFLQVEQPHLAKDREHIYHLLQIAEQKWRDANNTAQLAGVFAFRALLARQDGRMLEAVTWARQSLNWLPAEERTWRALSLTVAGVGEILDGKLPAARELLLQTLLLNERQGNLTYARAIRGMLSWASFERGELRHTAEQFRQIQAEARAQEDRDDIARSQLGLAHITYQWNNLEEAEQAVQEALELAEQMNVEELQALSQIRLALIEHARGQSTEAQQRLMAWLARRQAVHTPHSYQLAREAQAVLARIRLADGELAAVQQWFAEIEEREESLPLLQRRREQLLRARLLLAQGAMAEALKHLESLRAATQQTGHTYLRLEVEAALSLAYVRQGMLGKAREQLRALLEATYSENYLRLFLDEGEAMAGLLRTLLSRLHEKTLLTYVRRILSLFVQQSDRTAQETQPGTPPLLEPLSPQEQKVLRLLSAGNSNAEIAGELVVSINTVRTQLQSIYRKLNVNNRVEASAIARQLDLI